MPTNDEQVWTGRLERAGQGHLARHAATLTGAQRATFVEAVNALDMELVARLFAVAGEPATLPTEIVPALVTRRGADPISDARAEVVGLEMLAAGSVAALVVAGGQGSRLGHAGPKGTYPATPVREKTLFQLFAEKLRARGGRAGRPIPLLVMTSTENHADTMAFFAAHQHFGLDPATVHFFRQGMLPAVDERGRVVVRAPGELFLSPNGHGGSLLALHTSGVLDRLRAGGVSDVFYFQVDNPLVDLCDPVFLGHHRLSGSDFSSKVVSKTGPDEKVGVLARLDGVLGVVEYSDLPADYRNRRLADGTLAFSAGSIAIHAIRADFVARLNTGGFNLPYHVARKTLPIVDAAGATTQVAGIKFETFVFDALALARDPFALEVSRTVEFAPIKNASGVDSAATSRDLQSRLHASWLREAGIPVPAGPDGAPLHAVEISPLFADSAAGLRARSIPRINFDAPVYLGGE